MRGRTPAPVPLGLTLSSTAICILVLLVAALASDISIPDFSVGRNLRVFEAVNRWFPVSAWLALSAAFGWVRVRLSRAARERHKSAWEIVWSGTVRNADATWILWTVLAFLGKVAYAYAVLDVETTWLFKASVVCWGAALYLTSHVAAWVFILNGRIPKANRAIEVRA